MLFWAVDNPAPANYLLISGDRDFSNALHQLRMRRYNILLAQPLKASAALVAAAKSVWRWTTLVTGGPPLTTTQLTNMSHSHHDSSHISVSDPISTHQSSYPRTDTPVGGRMADVQVNPKFVTTNPNQFNISRASSMPILGIREYTDADHSQQPEIAPAIQFKKAPHEFFGASSDSVFSSSLASNIFRGNLDPPADTGSNSSYNQLAQPRSALHSENWFPPFPTSSDTLENTAASFTQLPDIRKPSISEDPNYSKNAVYSNQQGEKEFISNSVESLNLACSNGGHSGTALHASLLTYYNSPHNKYNHHHPAFPPPTSSSLTQRAIPRTSVWGNEECQPPPEYVQGLMGVILLALNTLKVEKLMPNEANIISCIRYGNPKYRSIDIRKALDFALEKQMIVKQNLGDMQLYVGRLERLWKCVNPIDSDTKQYPKAMWDTIQQFLASSSGHSVLMASESR